MKKFKSRGLITRSLLFTALLGNLPAAQAGIVKGMVVGAVAGAAIRHYASGSGSVAPQVPAASVVQQGLVEVGFSPEGSGEPLVLKVIAAAQRSILVSAYSFTSPNIVSALIQAKKKGVDVRVVADEKNNLVEDKSGKGRAALASLANAGIPTRVIGAYPIHHDKVMIVDRIHVQTGSFNYSSSAARVNSENVIVIWNNSAVANAYVDHWVDRFNKGHDLPQDR